MSLRAESSTEFLSEGLRSWRTVFELLRSRAFNQRDRLAYTFLTDGESTKEELTYGELDQRARVIGAWLQLSGAAGQRVMLLYPPGLEYLTAFFGCFYAAAIPVPVYPPKSNRHLQRLQAIVADAQASAALTTSSILKRLTTSDQIQEPGLTELRWLTTDGLAEEVAQAWKEPEVSGESLALLQYTSGSTGHPKGVMLSHRNLLHNSQLLSQCFEYAPESVCVSWLPVYHDMGLIGGVLQPLHGGFLSVLMPPAAFLQSPVRWLKAISFYRADISGGPNFAFDLCVRKISAEQRGSLDLSSWKVAFNGAEPIREETLERFARAFASCNFQRHYFFPCYGLAEATLLVTGSSRDVSASIARVEAGALALNKVVAASEDDEDVSVLVSSGRVLPGQHVRIVNPESLSVCAPEEVGEIWIAGSSVANGYFNRPEETAATFCAFCADTGEGPFLRTGDLGFIRDGELYVTGRLKDLIIIRGLNHYPQDVERTVEQSTVGVRPGCSAAFGVLLDGQERLVIVAEADNRRSSETDQTIENIKQAVAEEHEIQVYGLVLIIPGSLPKTSSGKIQRGACRTQYLEGSFQTVAAWHAALEPAGETAPIDIEPASREEPAIWLAAQVASILRLDRLQIDPSQSIIRHGLDSLMALELVHRIESAFGVSISLSSLLQGATVNDIAEQLCAPTVPARGSARPPGAPTETDLHPLSYGQQALWFLYQLAPDSAAYNLSSAVRIFSPLDRSALREAFQCLTQRHQSLRTSFTIQRGEPLQHIHEAPAVCFEEEDAAAWSNAFVQSRLNEEANRPFDLEKGPLLRISLFKRAAQDHVLLLTMHHIIGDFWSLSILVQELSILYEAIRNGTPATLPEVERQYIDFAYWQREELRSKEGEELWSYWQERLAGELPLLHLPQSKPRPAVQTYHGAAQSFKFDKQLTVRLKEMGQQHESTLYMLLLATFQILLHRYSGQDEIVIGSLTSGRAHAEFSQTMGYFVNPLVLRADLSGNPRFTDYLSRMKADVLTAFDHQDYPFPLITERLQPVRDASRSPIFQVMFVMQASRLLDETGVTALALGEAGAQLKLGSLSLESLALSQRVAQFDLTLVVAESADGINGVFEYNTDLFDADTMSRMAAHFQTLVAGIADNPNRRISELPLLAEIDEQSLVSWNETAAYFARETCIHQLFEKQAAKSPDEVALIHEDTTLTYRELNLRANRLAYRLRARGVGPEVLVGLCVERSIEMVVGLLGILKAGGAYVPLDSSYPTERLAYMLEDSQARVLLTDGELGERLNREGVSIVRLDLEPDFKAQAIDEDELENPFNKTTPGNLAYVIYTSGSTGKPKGVMLTHQSVVNFFAGMDQRIDQDATDALLAVTSISFDISVLELLWPLMNGRKVILMSEHAASGMTGQVSPQQSKSLDFSLFFFASEDSAANADAYNLLLEGAKFADAHGFTAVWTPERHFHAFGGLFPNPSVASAALAAVTKRLQIRAGSVVLPLHHPIRVAEEWSLVDNLSTGRVGIAFASGWHADDFVLAPENYAARKKVMFEQIETVRRLWRGEAIVGCGGAGNEVPVRVFPRPIQAELPIWITAAGDPGTFVRAGEIGANVLTHLLGQSIGDVAAKVKLYRAAREKHGHDAQAGKVTLMLHTFIGEDRATVRAKVRKPFTEYLRTSIGLISNLIKSLHLSLDLEAMSPNDMDDLLALAFDRYFETGALFGTPETCAAMIPQLKETGVDEIACLIDFGVDVESVLASLPRLDQLRKVCHRQSKQEDYSLAAQAAKHRATVLQCTSSLMRLLLLNPLNQSFVKSLRVLMLGGEALPEVLLRDVDEQTQARIFNMYGPTETTIWSAVQEMNGSASVTIGRPIANTQIYILDRYLQPVPVGVSGELCIGGEGLARGYFKLPELSAEKFIPNPFAKVPGSRLYRTGDLARFLPDGSIEFLGRLDYQVKVRGFRIELQEIEAALAAHPDVRESVVIVREDQPGDKRLVAYIVRHPERVPSSHELRGFVKGKLPEYMVPSAVVFCEALPLTLNGKVDRKALPAPDGPGAESSASSARPQTELEQIIASAWQETLNLKEVGVHDSFFDLGGHSLLLAQVHAQLRTTLNRNFPLIKMIENPTINALARYLNQETDQQFLLEHTQARAQKQRESLRRKKGLMRQGTHA